LIKVDNFQNKIENSQNSIKKELYEIEKELSEAALFHGTSKFKPDDIFQFLTKEEKEEWIKDEEILNEQDSNINFWLQKENIIGKLKQNKSFRL
jgi:hypothetical protein